MPVKSPHYSPVDQEGFTNHLPMLRLAWASFGANETQVESLEATYLQNNPIANLDDPYHIKTPFEKQYLDKAFAYEKMLENQGKKDILVWFLKDKHLMWGSAMFHGLMRVSYAAEAEDRLEISRALAYFDMVSMAIQLKGKPLHKDQLRPCLIALMSKRSKASDHLRGLKTQDRLTQVLRDAAIREALTEPLDPHDLVDYFAEIYTEIFMMTSDPYALHVLTGYQALLSLRPYIENFDRALTTFWLQAQLYFAITEKKQGHVAPYQHDPIPWQVVHDQALKRLNPHQIKLVYSLEKLDAITPHAYFKQLASRILKQDHGGDL